jgi:1,2-diacylglycerol 3-alpha-glucosyltransferase
MGWPPRPNLGYMRIGIVSKWLNRGQAFVSRYVRSALDELGHETHLLARPTSDEGWRWVDYVEEGDVWAGPRITVASTHEIPRAEYEDWVTANGLDLVFFDQNYDFESIAALRAAGVRTVGRFVWEQFSADDVSGAGAAFDAIYSVTRAERDRYAELGIESPLIRWGCHPELTSIVPDRPDDVVRYIFPGGMLGPRKPLRAVVQAFKRALNRSDDPRLRLLIRAQIERTQLESVERNAGRDPRFEVKVGDLPTAEHLKLFADCHVCLAPSRWEGLGLPLYEALAFGMPIITNNNPPMNEIVEDGVNGIFVNSKLDGTTPSGLPTYDIRVKSTRRAIQRLADDDFRADLTEGAKRMREERSWDKTVADFGELVETVAGSTSSRDSAGERR